SEVLRGRSNDGPGRQLQFRTAREGISFSLLGQKSQSARRLRSSAKLLLAAIFPSAFCADLQLVYGRSLNAHTRLGSQIPPMKLHPQRYPNHSPINRLYGPTKNRS